jgi:hypothetical protein
LADFDKFNIYCDESSTSDRYTVIGAVFCRASMADKVVQALDLIVAAHGGTSELKWSKVKKHNARMYEAVMTRAFELLHRGYIQYYAIVVDNSKLNHKQYNEGDKEIGFNKMLFQLLFKFVRSFRSRPRFFAFLDDRTTKHTPQTLRKMLNAKAAKDLQIHHNPYRYCEFHKSETQRLIQIADVISGAIAFRMNQKNVLTGAAQHKIDMMDVITKLAKVSDLRLPTSFPANGFDVWHIDFDAAARRKLNWKK